MSRSANDDLNPLSPASSTAAPTAGAAPPEGRYRSGPIGVDTAGITTNDPSPIDTRPPGGGPPPPGA